MAADRELEARLATEWARFLKERLECDVDVEFGRARTVPIRVCQERSGPRGRRRLSIRMHAFFGTAPAGVRDDVAAWIHSGRRARNACARLDAWIAEALRELPPRTPRKERATSRGRHHDLEALALPLYEEHFRGEFAATPRPLLTWGRRGRSRTRHSLRLGSYSPEDHLVRVHAVLDQPGVPAWFVRYILFHEILHAVIPPQRGNGDQLVHHGPAFRQREARYADYRRAVEWEEHNLPRLIRTARRGAPPQGPPPGDAAPERGSVAATVNGTFLAVGEYVQRLLF